MTSSVGPSTSRWRAEVEGRMPIDLAVLNETR